MVFRSWAIGEAGEIILMEIEEFFELVFAGYSVAVLWPYLQEAFNESE